MKNIYIILTNTGSYVSKFLNLHINGKYVHVSLSLDKDLSKAYSFGRKYTYTPLPGGFIKENYEKICKHFKNSESKIIELEITDEQYETLKKDLSKNYIKKQDDYKYNLLGLILIKYNIKYHRKNHLACSQFCGKILIENNIIDFKKDYSLITPEDFYQIKGKTIFEGKTIDYIKNSLNK